MSERGDAARVIEALGQRLASAVAAEFAGEPKGDGMASGAAIDEAAHDHRTDDVTHDLLDWVDMMADVSRDAIFAATDLTNASLRDPEFTLRLSYRRGNGDSITAAFWLHSAHGEAHDVIPRIGQLRNDSRHELAVVVSAASSSVREGCPAEFGITISGLDGASLGDYWGRVEAKAVRYSLPICLTIGS